MARFPVVGIFVGGRSERMGGRAKGLLPTPERGEPVVARLIRVAREALGGDVELTLVGRAADYASLGAPAIADAATDVGPLGGLVALLAHAHALGARDALALAGDLPFVTPALVRRLAEHSPGAAVVAPRSVMRNDGVWQPLFARYACAPALAAARACLAEGRRSLQQVIGALDAVELPIDAEEAHLLADWDRPEDVV